MYGLWTWSMKFMTPSVLSTRVSHGFVRGWRRERKEKISRTFRFVSWRVLRHPPVHCIKTGYYTFTFNHLSRRERLIFFFFQFFSFGKQKKGEERGRTDITPTLRTSTSSIQRWYSVPYSKTPTSFSRCLIPTSSIYDLSQNRGL